MMNKKGVNMGMLFGILILAIMAAAILPVAISNWIGANTTGWGAGEIAMWSIVPLLFVAAIAYGVYKKYMGGA